MVNKPPQEQGSAMIVVLKSLEKSAEADRQEMNQHIVGSAETYSKQKKEFVPLVKLKRKRHTIQISNIVIVKHSTMGQDITIRNLSFING